MALDENLIELTDSIFFERTFSFSSASLFESYPILLFWMLMVVFKEWTISISSYCDFCLSSSLFLEPCRIFLGRM